MISTNWSLRALACRVFGTVMITAMMAVTPGVLSAEDRDVHKFYKVLEKIPQPVIDPEEVRNAIRKGEAAKRRVETKRVVEAFEKGKQEWRDLV